MMRKHNRRMLLTSFAAGIAVVNLDLVIRPAAAGDVLENGGALVSAGIDLVPKVLPANRPAKGKATAVFNFHPADTQTTDYKKVFSTPPIINPNPFTLNYGGVETHGTSGAATFELSLQQVKDAKGNAAWQIGGKVKTTVKPGKSNPVLPVSVTADAADPIGFGADPEATFDFYSGGLNNSFSLGAGTAFDLGASANGDSMSFITRVAPDFISDPTEFWSDGLSGAVDLYKLVVTPVGEDGVQATLTFGAPSALFGLTFLDHAGVAFNPAVPADVAALEQEIVDGFTGRNVATDLNSLFTVGFVPQAGVSAYTIGIDEMAFAAGVETPEPSTWLLFVTGLLSLAGLRTVAAGRKPPMSLPEGGA